MNNKQDQIIIDFVLRNNLKIIPIKPIKDGKCSCNKENCTSPGKHPYLPYGWKLLATNDKSKIENWIKKFKHLNFAVPTGTKGSNGHYLVVVDIDDQHHKIVQTLPKTFRYKTGSGGYHYWYWSKLPLKNSVSLLSKKVDIRGDGGYVVIPPSNHISGNSYELIDGIVDEISFLPTELATFLNVKKHNEKRATVVKHEVSDLMKIWGEYTVADIKEMISGGKVKIPEGTRNYTIFRLLCSDRARGADKFNLTRKAFIYRKYCENYPTIEFEEINKIVDSVLKYPIYDNTHENVNAKYINWLEKNGIEKSAFLKTTLLNLDNIFFSNLKKGDKSTSLEIVSKVRKEFFELNKLEQYSVYKPSALGTKLKSLGFDRVRTAKCNLWNVDIEDFQNNVMKNLKP